MTGRRTRRAARRWLAVAVVAATVPATVGFVADAARAGAPRATASESACADFVALQEAFVGLGGGTTPKEIFASIHRAARVFRRVASDAPEAIADDMALLARSIGALDRKLASLASSVRPAQSRQQLDRMLGEIRDAFASWTRTQDVEALGTAQAAVDDWVDATCGFRLGAGDAATAGSR